MFLLIYKDIFAVFLYFCLLSTVVIPNFHQEYHQMNQLPSGETFPRSSCLANERFFVPLRPFVRKSCFILVADYL